MSQSIKCSNCNKEYNIPTATTFSKSCTCGIQIFRNTTDGIIFYHAKAVNHNYMQRIGDALGRFFLWSMPIFCLVGGIAFGIDKLGLLNRTPISNTSVPVIEQVKPIVATYSGNCTQYKLTLVNGNQKKYTPVAKAIGKIVIDHTAKKFTFTFNGKVVYTYTRFDSYQDNERGIEGYSLGGDWSAMRSNSAGTFTVYNSYTGKSPDLGYEYEITNYKLN